MLVWPKEEWFVEGLIGAVSVDDGSLDGTYSAAEASDAVTEGTLGEAESEDGQGPEETREANLLGARPVGGEEGEYAPGQRARRKVNPKRDVHLYDYVAELQEQLRPERAASTIRLLGMERETRVELATLCLESST